MIVAAALAASLQGCGGYSPVRYQPVAVPDMLTKVAANPNFKAAGGASFAEAVMLYPTRTGGSHHVIPVGDYLLSRVVLALPDGDGISKIRLDEYRSKCEGRGVFGPHLWCSTNARLTITAKGTDRTLEVADEADVGPVFIPGDVSFPFTMGDYLEGPVQAQARQSVDRLAAKLRKAFCTGLTL